MLTVQRVAAWLESCAVSPVWGMRIVREGSAVVQSISASAAKDREIVLKANTVIGKLTPVWSVLRMPTALRAAVIL